MNLGHTLTLCIFNDCGGSGNVVTSFLTCNSLTKFKFIKWVSFNPGVPLVAGHSIDRSIGKRTESLSG